MHYTNCCTPSQIQFPSSIGTDVTQLITLIMLTPENYHKITITQSHTLINLGLPLALCRVLYAHIATLADSYLTEPSQYHSLALLVVPCLISARVSWINPLLYRMDSVCPCLDYCLCTWIISLPCPFGYCSPIVDPRLP